MEDLDNVINSYGSNKRDGNTKRLLVEFIFMLILLTAVLIALTFPQLSQKKDNSLYDKAITLQDYSFCKYISSLDLKHKCFILTITTLADSKNNIAYCDLIPEFVSGNLGRQYSNKCRSGILFDDATSSFDSSYCTQITDSVLKQTCYDTISQKMNQLIASKSQCNFIRNQQKKDICLYDVFSKLKAYHIKPDFCNSFSYNEKKICDSVIASNEI